MICIITDKKKEVIFFLFLLLLKIFNVDRMTALPVDQYSWSTPSTTRIVKNCEKMILRKISCNVKFSSKSYYFLIDIVSTSSKTIVLWDCAKMILRKILGWIADFKAHDKKYRDLWSTRNQHWILVLVDRHSIESQ